ncbi:hypothetical protein MPSEU_000475500 [Mayamaea pseudoterrestris]|nr:hypothetical protein MPSEU_000475500 [Mayamaea pseudoterrestris]
MVDSKVKGAAKRRRGRQDSSYGLKKPKHQNAERLIESEPQQENKILALTEDEPTWYKLGHQQAERNATITTDPPAKGVPRMTSELVSKYRRQADELYQKELFASNKGSGKTSDDRWVEGTMKKGTLKDRIAAMSVVASTDSIHKLYALDGLLQMAGCSESGSQQTNSRVVQLAAEALEELFINTYLPPDRKLHSLAQRPFYLFEHVEGAKKQTIKTLSPKVLLLWRFEELVKDKYHRFLHQCLDKTLRDGMEMDKISALRTTSSLLTSVSEGERILLQLIVNKLGDPSKKVAAAAGHELRKVLQKHPSMQLIIAREVQQLAFRPGLKSRALYHCISFLNQLKLQRDKFNVEGSVKASLPASLISSYFRLFDVAIGKQPEFSDDREELEMKSRLLSALLSGVNRAHPYLPEKDKGMDDHLDSLYRVVHTAPPAACTQALLLLFHVAVGSNSDQDGNNEGDVTDAGLKRQQRFYRALYASLSKTSMLSSGKHLTMLFNLLYKAMKYDTDTTRVIAFTKRVMCTTMHCSSAVLAASLFLLNEIARRHSVVLSCFHEALEDPHCRRVLDPTKREPSGALSLEGVPEEGDCTVKKAPLWELALVKHHFHPSVDKFTDTLGSIGYNGDPLRDFGLLTFLDKFAYRNPKSSQHVIERIKQGTSVGVRRSGRDNIIQSLSTPPVNDSSFLHRQKVDVHEEFFHRFFVERARRDDKRGLDTRKSPGEMDEEQDEEEVLHEEEQFDVGRSFEEFERGWDSDSDEEAFVDSLAQEILEDEIDRFGPDELDAEDPNMAGWDDLYDADSADDRTTLLCSDHRGTNGLDAEDDDGEFLEVSNEDFDSDSEAPSLLNIDEGELGADEGDAVNENDDVDIVLGESDDDEVIDEHTRERPNHLPTFADAEEYEVVISESLTAKNRQYATMGLGRREIAPESGKKRKKRMKKH